MNGMWIFWLIAAGIFFVGEVMTIGFLIFWFGIGSLLAMITSLFTDSLIIQSIVFLVSSTTLVLFTKPIVNKYISKSTVPTNVYSIIDKIGFVTKEISMQSSGQVKVDGETWTAVSEDSNILKEGSEIKVVKIDGVKLVVALINNP